MNQKLKCHAMGCDREIDILRFACKSHWAIVPNDLKHQIRKFLTPEGYPEFDEDFRRLALKVIILMAEYESSETELESSAREMVYG